MVTIHSLLVMDKNSIYLILDMLTYLCYIIKICYFKLFCIVKNIEKNLVSISQLSAYNNVAISFDKCGCVVIDKVIG